MKRILTLMLALTVTCTLFLSSCKKEQKTYDPHELLGEIYAGTVHGKPAKIALGYLANGFVQIVEVAEVESCVITTLTTRYGLATERHGNDYTYIEFDSDYLMDQNGDKAWLPLYVTVTITGDGADEMKASLLGRTDNFEDAKAKQKYIDICNGKTVAVYEYDEELWGFFVSAENIVIEIDEENKTFTQIIDEE